MGGAETSQPHIFGLHSCAVDKGQAQMGTKKLALRGLSLLLRWVGCGIRYKGTQKTASSLSSAVHLDEAHVPLLRPPSCPLWWDPCPLPWICTLAGSMLNFFRPIHISFSFCAIRL